LWSYRTCDHNQSKHICIAPYVANASEAHNVQTVAHALLRLHRQNIACTGLSMRTCVQHGRADSSVHPLRSVWFKQSLYGRCIHISHRALDIIICRSVQQVPCPLRRATRSLVTDFVSNSQRRSSVGWRPWTLDTRSKFDLRTSVYQRNYHLSADPHPARASHWPTSSWQCT